MTRRRGKPCGSSSRKSKPLCSNIASLGVDLTQHVRNRSWPAWPRQARCRPPRGSFSCKLFTCSLEKPTRPLRSQASEWRCSPLEPSLRPLHRHGDAPVLNKLLQSQTGRQIQFPHQLPPPQLAIVAEQAVAEEAWSELVALDPDARR